jgi:molybdopterin/thiamine biosynthesis adenylyltransferase
MQDYFLRQIELWGEETQNSLRDKRVAVIGCGGLGSSVAIPLGSSGVGKMYLIDFDSVSLHNIHRQIAFKMDDIDKPKAKVLAKLLKERCPYVEEIPLIMDFDEFSKQNIYVDLIIDATDNLIVREKIDKYAKKQKIPWVYGSVEEHNGQVCFFDKASFDVFKITQREVAGVAPPIVMQIASLQANLALRYLAGEEVEKDLLYYLSYKDGIFEVNKFKIPIN